MTQDTHRTTATREAGEDDRQLGRTRGRFDPRTIALGLTSGAIATVVMTV